MQNKLIILFWFFTVTALAQTTDDTLNHNGVWVFRVDTPYMNVNTANNLANFAATNSFIKGAFVQFYWKDIEPQPGVYNWRNFDSTLNKVASVGWKISLSVRAGPDCPQWIYNAPYNVPKVYTNDTDFAWSYYPYYFDTNNHYQTRWYLMVDSVANHIDNLQTATRNKIIIYQTAEGTTEDALTPYKGQPLNGNYAISLSQWSTFKQQYWLKVRSIYSTKTPLIHVKINHGNNSEHDVWLSANYPEAWRKTGDIAHGYQLNDEIADKLTIDPLTNTIVSNCQTQVRTQAEMDEMNRPYYAKNVVWNSYWHAVSNLHIGLDAWENKTGPLGNSLYYPAFELFAKYAGFKDPACSPYAFCALRRSLDANDFTAFPSTIYGTGTQNDSLGEQRGISIANGYAFYGASQDDPAAAIDDASNQRRANAMNDVGWNIIPDNYERYITQINPNSTSRGYWRQGDSTQPYGRFARGFDHNSGRDTMYFNIDDHFFTSFPNDSNTVVKIKITYLDKGASKWSLMYDAVGPGNSSSIKTAFTNTNTNTTNNHPITNTHRNQRYVWKTKEVVITDGRFGNGLPNGADFMLSNADSANDIFHMIEIEKVTMTSIPESARSTVNNSLVIQPNPAINKEVTIALNAELGEYNLSFYSIDGQYMGGRNIVLQMPGQLIHLSEFKTLPTGIYIIKAEFGPNNGPALIGKVILID